MPVEINTLAIVFSVTDNYTVPQDDMILTKHLKSILLFLHSMITVNLTALWYVHHRAREMWVWLILPQLHRKKKPHM